MMRLRGTVLYATLVGCGLGVSLIFTAIAPVLSTIAVRFGGGTYGNILAQLMMTLPSIGVIVGGPAMGLLADRFGTRRLLLGALAGYGVFGCSGLLIDSAYVLLASRFALGVAAVGVATAATALIGEVLEDSQRPRALGYSSAVASVGAVASILFAGSLAEYGGWHLPFSIYGVAFVLLLMGWVSLPGHRYTEIAARPSSAEAWSILLGFWRLYAAVVAVSVVVFMTGIQVSFLLAADGITEPGSQAWIIAAASVGATLGATFYGWLQARIGRELAFVLCLGAMGLGNLTMGSQHRPALLALGCALNGFGGGMTVPYFGSRLIEQVPAALRARALGFMYTMIFLGEFANPWVVTPLHLHFGMPAAFIVIGVAGALAAIGTLACRLYNGRVALKMTPKSTTG